MRYVGAATAFSGSLTKLFSARGEVQNNGKFPALCYEFLDISNAMYQDFLATEKRSDRAYHVEFRDVSFKYPGTDVWTLRHVNVKFMVGSRLAIVGENGSGKATFIKLLCRLYDPQEGEILLNGINTQKYDYRDYLDIFSIVFQDFQLRLVANRLATLQTEAQQLRRILQNAPEALRLRLQPGRAGWPGRWGGRLAAQALALC